MIASIGKREMPVAAVVDQQSAIQYVSANQAINCLTSLFVVLRHFSSASQAQNARISHATAGLCQVRPNTTVLRRRSPSQFRLRHALAASVC